MTDGNNWLLGDGKDCVSIRYYDEISFADNIPTPLVEAQLKYNWKDSSAKGQASCDKLNAAASAKITSLKVSKASSRATPPNTRPTYDITATTKTGNRVLEYTPCEGLPIKSKYYKIRDKNETAVCEEY